MTHPERCPAVMLTAARPRITAVETARVAGRPIPTDWRCTRRPHGDNDQAPGQHLAMPLGITGPSFRFDDTQRQPCTTCPPPGPDTTSTTCPDCGTDYALTARPHIDRLIDQLAGHGVAVVQAAAGDSILLLLADGGDTPADPADPDGPTVAEQATRLLAYAYPNVSFLALSGITGAVVMPRATSDITTELVAAPQDAAPAYAHRLLDSLLDGRVPHFRGAWLPKDLQDRLAASTLPYEL